MENDNSPKIFLRHFFIFYIKVAVIHTLTYIVFGLLFSNLFNYESVYNDPIIINFMRGFESPLTVIGPFLQPIRAVFIAIALFPIRRIIASKLGWLIVWLIFICIGVISAPISAPSSIEGIIYTQIPIKFHIISFPEVFIQTLAFSLILWVAEIIPHSEKEFSNREFLVKIFLSVIYTMFGIFLTSVCGIIIMNFLELNYQDAKLDRGTISYLSTISILTIIISYSFANKVSKNKWWLLLTIPLILIIYIAFPYGYNYIFNTVYNNNMALIPYISSAVLMVIIYCLIFVLFYGKLKNRHKKTEEVYREDNSNKDYNEVKVIEINPDDDKTEDEDIKVIELTPENDDSDKK